MLTATRLALCLLAYGPLALAGCDRVTGPSDGVRERWYVAQVGHAYARPVIGDGVVYFGTGDGQIVARDRATGAARWVTTIAPGQEIGGANLVLRAGVVVAPVAYDVVGLDAATGRKLWQYKPPADVVGFGPGLPGYVYRHTVDVDDEVAYIPAWGASVSAVDLRTGAARWVWQPGRTATDTAAERFRGGSDAVRVSGDTVFATAWHSLDVNGLSGEAWLVALDRASGRELWRVTVPVRSNGVATRATPALWRGLTLFNTIAGDLYAVDRRTQQITWHVEPDAPGPGAVRDANLASAAVVGDVVYHNAGDGYLYARRASDGALLWRPSTRASSPPT
jgi:outer membrane protein assembly factor BamB